MSAKSQKFNLRSRPSRAIIGLLALLATYVVALRAIETGHLWQYAVVLGLFLFGIVYLVKAIRGK